MYEKYTEEIYNELKEQYLILYKQSEDLYKENIHIYYDYNYTFGMYYYKRYNLYYLIEKNAKRIEIYTDKIANGLLINSEAIENEIDEEFEELLKKVNLIKNEHEQAIIFKNIPMMEEADLKELIETFGEIIKYIHPDLRSHDDVIRKLWKKSASAYRNNDIEALRKCRTEIDALGLEIPRKEDLKIDYESRIKNFKENIEILTTKNAFLINSFPYNQKGILKSEELIINKIKAVEEDIKLFERRLANLESIFEEFLNVNQKYIC